MNRTGGLLATIAAASLPLAGCNTADPPKTSLPKPPDFSLAQELQSTPAVPPPMPGSEERFLRLLDVWAVPYTGTTAQQEASIVCATFAADPTATRDQVASLQSFPELQQRRWWVDSAVEVYCPQFSER